MMEIKFEDNDIKMNCILCNSSLLNKHFECCRCCGIVYHTEYNSYEMPIRDFSNFRQVRYKFHLKYNATANITNIYSYDNDGMLNNSTLCRISGNDLFFKDQVDILTTIEKLKILL